MISVLLFGFSLLSQWTGWELDNCYLYCYLDFCGWWCPRWSDDYCPNPHPHFWKIIRLVCRAFPKYSLTSAISDKRHMKEKDFVSLQKERAFQVSPCQWEGQCGRRWIRCMPQHSSYSPIKVGLPLSTNLVTPCIGKALRRRNPSPIWLCWKINHTQKRFEKTLQELRMLSSVTFNCSWKVFS